MDNNYLAFSIAIMANLGRVYFQSRVGNCNFLQGCDVIISLNFLGLI